MSRHIFRRTGLVGYNGQPGPNWGEFTQSFDRTDPGAMGALGGLTTRIVMESMEGAGPEACRDAVAQFAAEAEPPIPTPEDIASNDTEGWIGALAFDRAVTAALESAPQPQELQQAA